MTAPQRRQTIYQAIPAMQSSFSNTTDTLHEHAIRELLRFELVARAGEIGALYTAYAPAFDSYVRVMHEVANRAEAREEGSGPEAAEKEAIAIVEYMTKGLLSLPASARRPSSVSIRSGLENVLEE